MKKTLSVLLAFALLLLCFCACGDDGGVITLGPENSGDPGTSDIFAFVYKNTVVHMGDLMLGKAGCLYEKLGTPVGSSSSISCAYQGLDKEFIYNGFTIFTYPDNELDYVLTVLFTDDLVSTPAGIHIGSTEAEVKAAYGDGTRKENSVVYTKGTASIGISFENGVVKGLQYDYVEK